MPKNKKATSASEGFKEAGNRFFTDGKFSLALDQYTKAIEQSGSKQNHIYYANRANCYLELWKNDEAIIDCNMAIIIDPTFSKAYLRKAKALFNNQKEGEALVEIEWALKLEPNNP